MTIPLYPVGTLSSWPFKGLPLKDPMYSSGEKKKKERKIQK